MSLKFTRVRQLVRYNSVYQKEIKACICSTTTLQQDREKVSHETQGRGSLKLIGIPEVPKYVEKEKMITRAIQLFLEKRKAEAASREKNRKELDLGERHLANIMGVNIDDLSRNDVKKALRYLMPSGLYSKKARPTMEMPIDMLVERQAITFTEEGKPKHFLYYTLKPTYFALMHQMALLLEEIRTEQAKLHQEGKTLDPITYEEMEQKETFDKLVRLGLVSFPKLKKRFDKEKVSAADEVRFEQLLDRIVSQPLAYKRMNFFSEFPKPDQLLEGQSERKARPVPVDQSGNKLYKASGSRKSIQAEVQLKSNGTGEVMINNEDILFFDDVTHRQAVLFPLKFIGQLGKFDIKATVSSLPGQDCASAQAGAIRLGVAKAIELFATDEEWFRMQKAGLLTRDPRRNERKKPGQEGARKKFTWKAR